MLPLSFDPHCDHQVSLRHKWLLFCSHVWGKWCVFWVQDLPHVHRYSCTGGWVGERDWYSSRYMVGYINVEGINKVLAQWIWTVSWKCWELLIFEAHWFKKGQEIATWLQLWGGLSKALCWCKEELKSLRYYTSKGAAWGFRKKKQAKVFASIYSSQAPASQAGVWLQLRCCCQLGEDANAQLAPSQRTRT